MQTIIVPRWSGRPSSDWYPWLIAQLPHISVLEMPTPDEPTIENWVGAVSSALLELEQPAKTILVGHSVGCQAVLRALLATKQPVAAVLLVAAWLDVDERWPSIVPWIEAPLDLLAAQAYANQRHVLISDNDPFTSDWQGNRKLWHEAFAADVSIATNAKHFNGPESQAVLVALQNVQASTGFNPKTAQITNRAPG
jgi:uncharacterized protein